MICLTAVLSPIATSAGVGGNEPLDKGKPQLKCPVCRLLRRKGEGLFPGGRIGCVHFGACGNLLHPKTFNINELSMKISDILDGKKGKGESF
jgi:hypothetical protein